MNQELKIDLSDLELEDIEIYLLEGSRGMPDLQLQLPALFAPWLTPVPVVPDLPSYLFMTTGERRG